MQNYKPITKEDVEKWADELYKSGKIKYPVFENLGKVEGSKYNGLYYLGQGVYGGKRAWEAYQKAWQEKIKELSKK